MQKEIQELKKRIAELEAKLDKSVFHNIPAKTLEWGKLADEEMEWEEANEWCESQGDGWRLPDIDELFKAWCDKVPGFGSGTHWSATEHSKTYVRTIYFTDGFSNTYYKTDSNSVRCVRTVK